MHISLLGQPAEKFQVYLSTYGMPSCVIYVAPEHGFRCCSTVLHQASAKPAAYKHPVYGTEFLTLSGTRTPIPEA